MLFLGHQDPEFVAATAGDAELIETLRDFALADWMLGTDAAFLAENAARELGRFSQYRDAGIYPIVNAAARTILERYDPYERGRFVWIATAATVAHYDGCAAYGICGFRAELEAATLPVEHTCSQSARVRAQNLGEADLLSVCALLGATEARFHAQLRTGGEPGARRLQLRCRSGGVRGLRGVRGLLLRVLRERHRQRRHLPGGRPGANPRTPPGSSPTAPPGCRGNRSGTSNTNWCTTWTAASTCAGGFWDYRIDTHSTVWWVEGLAEYISKGNTDETAVHVGRSGATRLSEAFRVKYDHGSTAVYRWSYLAARFMFERHRDDIDVFLRHFRAGGL